MADLETSAAAVARLSFLAAGAASVASAWSGVGDLLLRCGLLAGFVSVGGRDAGAGIALVGPGSAPGSRLAPVAQDVPLPTNGSNPMSGTALRARCAV